METGVVGKAHIEVSMRRGFVLAGIFVFCAQAANAGLCQPREYTFDEISRAPVLAVVRVVSLWMANGPPFTGDPKASAPPQEMTAAIEVLRSLPAGAAPHFLHIRFTGRDGPDFLSCPEHLPELPPGQVLLLPLSRPAGATYEPWRLIGTAGYWMTTCVAAEMREPQLAGNQPRLFIIRELVNSFSSSEAMARYTAAVLLGRQSHYLEPELISELQEILQNDQPAWARLLGSIFLSYASSPALTVSNLNLPRQDWTYNHLESLPLARIALSHLNPTTAEALVWQGIVKDLPALADDPYHPLFAYNWSPALRVACWFLLPYHDNPAFIAQLRSALREDRAGSSWLASFMIDQGQKAFLPEALNRAMQVITRPGANSDDLLASVILISKYGSEVQRTGYRLTARRFRSSHPDYAAYLERVGPSH